MSKPTASYRAPIDQSPQKVPGSPTPAVEVVLPDEDTFVIPSGWRRSIHPRRGGMTAPSTRPDSGAATVMTQRVSDNHAVLDEVLDDPRSEQPLVQAARAYLRGEVTPVGAAVIAAIIGSVRPWNRSNELARFADAWTATQGLVFAATATAELAEIVMHRTYFDRGHTQSHVSLRRPGDQHSWEWIGQDLARRVRTFLVNASDQDYQDTLDALAGCRHGVFQRLVTSYLAPTRQDWVDQACATAVAGQLEGGWLMLLCALGSVEQAALLADRAHLGWLFRSAPVVFTLLDGVGPAIAPVLADLLDDQHCDAEGRGHLLTVLSALPTDQALSALIARLDYRGVQPAMQQAMRRFPARALRLLASAAAGRAGTAPPAADLLRAHMVTHPELTATVRTHLPAELRAIVDTAATRRDGVPEAAADALPCLLVEPPWTRRRATTPLVVGGLTPPTGQDIAWAPGEQQEWATTRIHHPQRQHDWDALARTYLAGHLAEGMEPVLFDGAPAELIAPMLADWRPRDLWQAELWTRRIVARFGLDALPLALHVARSNPSGCATVLLPFVGTEVTLLMADWLARLKSARGVAATWFGRHGEAAAPILVPVALGKPGVRRRAAENALRLLASTGRRAEVVQAARRYGETAVGAIDAMLEVNPLDVLPARMPAIDDWADARLLPQVLLHGRDRALPLSATTHLITMLALSGSDEVYPGVPVVRQICDPGSLAEFGWALFERWRVYEMPANSGWAFTALGWIGDDDTVRRLAPLIRAWPGEGGHSRAVKGLDVLVRIGTDAAVAALHAISQKVRSKGLRTRAQERITAIAADRGLSPEQLADRLVPDLGLGRDGSLTLDYGPRQFLVGFDEQLKPFVADGDGRRRRDLPKPGVHDDQDLAPAAHKRFVTLKKDVRTIAADQIRRLESAMVTQRRWTASEFWDLFAGHPLLWHVVRRLVWCSEGAAGVGWTFRLAEDRTLADVNDDTVTLPESARVGVAHPLHLAGTLTAWAEVFADYEILQPFPQLGRAVYTLTDDERASGTLRRFDDVTVPTGKVLGLTRRGWDRAVPEDGGVEPWILRTIPGDRVVVIELDPGIAAGSPDMFPEQRLAGVWISDQPDPEWLPGTSRRFTGLDSVTASEVLADLTGLTR